MTGSRVQWAGWNYFSTLSVGTARNASARAVNTRSASLGANTRSCESAGSFSTARISPSTSSWSVKSPSSSIDRMRSRRAIGWPSSSASDARLASTRSTWSLLYPLGSLSNRMSGILRKSHRLSDPPPLEEATPKATPRRPTKRIGGILVLGTNRPSDRQRPGRFVRAHRLARRSALYPADETQTPDVRLCRQFGLDLHQDLITSRARSGSRRPPPPAGLPSTSMAFSAKPEIGLIASTNFLRRLCYDTDRQGQSPDRRHLRKLPNSAGSPA